MASSKDGLEFLPYYRQLLDLLETNEDIKRTIIGVFGQMSWAASGAGVGGLVAGPPGALIGGIAGSVIGYMRSDDYSSMMGVLRGLTDEEKENLVNEVQGVVGSTAVEDLSSFIGSPGQREVLVNCIREFIKVFSGESKEDSGSGARGGTSTTDGLPPYNPDWAGPRAPSAPVLPSEDYSNSQGGQVYPDLPPPYSERRMYPDLNGPTNEKIG